MDNKITYKINTENAIDVEKLANSLLAVKNQYLKSTNLNDVEVKISEVRKGSFEFDFIMYIGGILPLMESYNVASDFFNNTKNILSYIKNFKKNTELKKDVNLYKANVADVVSMLEPIIEEKGGDIQIIINSGSGIVYNKCTITSEEAKTIKKESYAILENQDSDTKEEITNKIFLKQSIRPIQLRSDGKKGYKIKCKNISTKELPVDFQNKFLSSSMTSKKDPFNFTFIVDLQVEYVNGKPKSYTILNIYDAIEEDKGLFSNIDNE